MNKDQLASAYRLIAELLLYPEDRNGDLIEAELRRLDKAPAELRASFDAFIRAPAAGSVEEYVTTLELAPAVPLYLGAHLFEEPNSCRGAGMSGRNAYMLELANIYRHFGIEFVGGEMADFVPVVVEFLGLSLERRHEDNIGLRRYLLETKLIDGVESLLSALRKYESPYAHLLEALLSALTDDIQQMAGEPKWQPPAKDDRPRVPAATGGLSALDRTAIENGVEL